MENLLLLLFIIPVLQLYIAYLFYIMLNDTKSKRLEIENKLKH